MNKKSNNFSMTSEEKDWQMYMFGIEGENTLHIIIQNISKTVYPI